MPEPFPAAARRETGPGTRDGAGARLVPPVLLAAIVGASRLPFLAPGYGVDSDAWRLAVAARHLGTTGEYAASRLPGHPVQEFASALLWVGGPPVVNGATALWSVVAAVVFALLVRRLGLPHPWLSGLALAFVPGIYVNSVNALDHLWGLAFFLLAAYLVSHPRAITAARPLAAGLVLALAVGCRITYLFALWPLGLVLLRRGDGSAGDGAAGDGPRPGPFLRFAAPAVVVGLAAYLPALSAYGPGFLRTYETGYPRWEFVVKQATLDLWGLAGGIAVALALLLVIARAAREAIDRRARRAGLNADPRRALWMRVSLWTVLLVAGLYLLLPHDAGYLLPAVPFVLLLLAVRLPPPAYAALCLALVVSPFVLELTEPVRLRGPDPARPSQVVRLAGHSLRLEPFRGPILHDRARRISELAFVDRLLERARRLPGEQTIVVHDWLPAIRVRSGATRADGVRFVATLSFEELERLQAAGVRVRYLAEAEAPNAALHGYRLSAQRATLFEPRDPP